MIVDYYEGSSGVVIRVSMDFNSYEDTEDWVKNCLQFNDVFEAIERKLGEVRFEPTTYGGKNIHFRFPNDTRTDRVLMTVGDTLFYTEGESIIVVNRWGDQIINRKLS